MVYFAIVNRARWANTLVLTGAVALLVLALVSVVRYQLADDEVPLPERQASGSGAPEADGD